MKDTLIKLSKDFNLIERSIEYAKAYIKDWKEEYKEDFIEFFSDYNLEKTLPNDFSVINFVVAKIRHEVRLDQENLEALQVVMYLTTFDSEDNHEYTVCTYCCYYDMNGEYMDDFIDC